MHGDQIELIKQLQHKLDNKTKPIGSLGQLESLAMQVALLQNTHQPQLAKPKLLLFAGDHGIARAGVSAYPQEVTWQMVMNFVGGGAACRVFARQLGIELEVIDVGVAHTFDSNLPIVHAKVAASTHNCLEQNAMTLAQQKSAMQVGKECVQTAVAQGCNVIALGEMGIGNTASASLLMASLLSLPLEECTGRGTGHDDAGLARKGALLNTALTSRGATTNANTALERFGGFEIAAMVGAILEASANNLLVLIDGFIVTAAALVALRLKPSAHGALVFAHQSSEHAHAKLLGAIGAKPLLNLGLRLGEGTGALLAYPLIEAAVNMLNQMASFESAQVATK